MVKDVVAPYTGAWIETRAMRAEPAGIVVAPYTGAWIETTELLAPGGFVWVAPYTGAWIETLLWWTTRRRTRSRALHGRVD